MSSTQSGSARTWSTGTTASGGTHRARVRRWLTRLRPRLRHGTPAATTFTKAYPDYLLGEESERDATWTAAPAPPRHAAPPPGVADDDYVSFMRRGRAAPAARRRREREPRYLSFSHDVDLDAVDLSAPAKRRLSFRWSDLARSHSTHR